MRIALTALFLLMMAGSASAAAQNPLAQPCAAEIQRYCRTIAPAGHLGCLRAEQANLGPACRAAYQALNVYSEPGGDTVPRPNAIIGHDTATGATAPQQGSEGAQSTPAPRGDGY
jgi:hypothetical protein